MKILGTDGVVRDMTPEEIKQHEQLNATTQPSFEERAAALLADVDAFMDERAREYRYDNLRTAVTYADEPAVPRFQAEGRAFRRWRSLVYAHLYALMDRVAAGEVPEPTRVDVLTGMPQLEIDAT